MGSVLTGVGGSDALSDSTVLTGHLADTRAIRGPIAVCARLFGVEGVRDSSPFSLASVCTRILGMHLFTPEAARRAVLPLVG